MLGSDDQIDTVPCEIQHAGKSRNGTDRWWCRTHGASATGRGGTRLPRCEHHYLGRLPKDVFRYSPTDYPGGVAIWGAVPPIYNTSPYEEKPGIHVHARTEKDGPKCIDRTYDAVIATVSTNLFEYQDVLITKEAAVGYYVSHFLGRQITALRCTHCEALHTDQDYYAVEPHIRHQCNSCGRIFRASTRGISNPVAQYKYYFPQFRQTRSLIIPDRELNIQQSDYLGGVQIWASNPALLWTAEKPEEKGIHIHLYHANARRPVIDNTYSRVTIDGMTLDVTQIHYYMAQKTLSFLGNRIVSLTCPTCQSDHFDEGDWAFYPHEQHLCEHCGRAFKTTGRKRKVVSNPIRRTLELLALQSKRAKEERE
ncbi:hypothetical protein [Ferruginivarius sediminum]|uniref:hypothetical protein n=1 Tax=Ferruginivarius sediminum TaxID=2661937 RepID=UPI0011C05D9E|nr:hypothetical protein [Ferruginivarius sediminum]